MVMPQNDSYYLGAGEIVKSLSNKTVKIDILNCS